MRRYPRLWCLTFSFIGAMLAGCSAGLPTATATKEPTATPTPSPTPTSTASITNTPTLTPTSTATDTPSPSPTVTHTATPAATPTPSLSPTPEPITATADGTVNCRYGPSQAYLYAWGLHEGDIALVKGKNANGTWLWVEPPDTTWTCWVSASAMSLDGDLGSVKIVYPSVITHPDVPGPSGVSATRSGDSVTISWDAAPPSEGLGYLIEARICLGAYLWDVAYQTQNTSYTIKDPQSCAGDSYGQLRVFNKLGYSESVKIPWP